MVVSPDNVKSAQQALKARGLNPGIDGRMDEKTQQALRDFQKANNLPATGVLDQKTAAKLGVTINEQERSAPSRGEDSTSPKSSGSIR
jgi:carboxyl-terminal processing protease